VERGRLSFAALLGTDFLLSVSLVVNAAVAAFGRYAWGWVPALAPMLELADFLGSMLLHTLLFAMIFKLLPDAPIRWREVWLGAGVTAALFFVGKRAIGLYLGTSEIGAAYGAAGWVLRFAPYISTIPSPTFLSRSSTSGSWPGSTSSGDDASSRIFSNAEYIRGRS
jgi:uncharacterized BrkB/YihY/UPF0761 family membrane protein